jgi:hypothetical protein
MSLWQVAASENSTEKKASSTKPAVDHAPDAEITHSGDMLISLAFWTSRICKTPGFAIHEQYDRRPRRGREQRWMLGHDARFFMNGSKTLRALLAPWTLYQGWGCSHQ